MSDQKKETVSGAFVLTPAAGKRLIGLAVASLPEVRYAYEKGRLAIANGTTTGYVIEALTGQPLKKFEYCVGVIAEGTFGGNPANDHTLMLWEKGKATNLPFPQFLPELRKFQRGDVFIKGANAVDPQFYAGGLQCNPNGGSWADAFGLITARGLYCVVPVGLEKMIPSVVEASRKAGQLRLDYCIGNSPGVIPLPSFTVVTEIQALEILSGVRATVIAAGGIGGSEGARSFVIEGTEEQVKSAFSFVLRVHGEPPVQVTGKVESEPNRLPQGL
ncbi:MAG: hypothetical protein CVU64_04125 [Deltaproteobacteria bacterium HGW-Deltaproteobacteria-21]|nr:MAG: hypothetical protein CVU64_04125 [Deltaproteobacteria bacterium HGW-Deltaproteobacteria-21]